MRKVAIIVSILAALGLGTALYLRSGNAADGGTATNGSGRPGGTGAFARPPMTVELTRAKTGSVSDRIMIVGSLIGSATVDVVPKVSGRLQSVAVRMGDPVRKGQLIAKVEDGEIQEQVKQVSASFEVARATVRQREADLKFSEINVERSRSLFNRDLLAKQTLDDAEARLSSSVAQLDLARAQFEQAKARLEELQINLANTQILSPVDGFVGRRNLDPGAYVGTSAPVASVVDISLVRLIVNLVEKDLRRIATGMAADLEVDAFPGETFNGRIARLAPVLDPATRTAQMEIEVPNVGFRLKPGMYARVRFTVAKHDNAVVVPRNAIVDIDGVRGVFVATATTVAFRPIEAGLQEGETVEVLKGLANGETVVTTGAPSLRDGDTIVVPGQQGRGGRGGRGGARQGAGSSDPQGRR